MKNISSLIEFHANKCDSLLLLHLFDRSSSSRWNFLLLLHLHLHLLSLIVIRHFWLSLSLSFFTRYLYLFTLRDVLSFCEQFSLIPIILFSTPGRCQRRKPFSPHPHPHPHPHSRSSRCFIFISRKEIQRFTIQLKEIQSDRIFFFCCIMIRSIIPWRHSEKDINDSNGNKQTISSLLFSSLSMIICSDLFLLTEA